MDCPILAQNVLVLAKNGAYVNTTLKWPKKQ